VATFALVYGVHYRWKLPAALINQLTLAHELREDLVTLQLQYDTDLNSIWSAFPDVAHAGAAVAPAESAANAAADAVKAERIRQRTNRINGPLADQLAAARAELKSARQRRRDVAVRDVAEQRQTRTAQLNADRRQLYARYCQRDGDTLLSEQWRMDSMRQLPQLRAAEIEASRTRIAEAADEARRRIERDLHESGSIPARAHVQAEIEFDNLRTAFAWSHENDNIAEALELASSLQPLWLARGRLVEGLAWIEAALADRDGDRPEMPSAVRARALADNAVLNSWVDVTVSLDQAQEALAIARDAEDPALLTRALTACACITAHDPELARPYFEEAIGMARALGDSWRLSQILGQTGLRVVHGRRPSRNRTDRQRRTRPRRRHRRPIQLTAVPVGPGLRAKSPR
jgi:hypothetical protein